MADAFDSLGMKAVTVGFASGPRANAPSQPIWIFFSLTLSTLSTKVNCYLSKIQLSGPTYVIQGVPSVYHSDEIFMIKLCRVNIFNRHALTPPLSLSLSKIA
jgi:hypothetical protein